MKGKTMNLEKLYNEINTAISQVDFNQLWEGFHPSKYALYTDDECFFDGRYVEKTTDFCANTVITYQGEVIAIWYVQEHLDTSVFASKIIHEMFHAFQEQQGWKCFPNEKEALFEYRYNAENLGLKLYENKLLLELLDGFSRETYEKLLASRKYRSEKFPYEFNYECGVEEIEGSANYVEWQVLRQLDAKKADELVADVRDFVVQPEFFFPIRIAGYYTGLLLINAMVQAGDFFYTADNRPVIAEVLEDMSTVAVADFASKDDMQAVSKRLDTYIEETKQIIQSAVAGNDEVATGPLELVCVNIGDARFYDGYLISRFFVLYMENDEKKLERGNFVVKMKDQHTIDTIFRWN